MEPLLLNKDEQRGSVKCVLQELQDNNVILIRGTLGNGVSKTGKQACKVFIQNHSDWQYHWINYRDCSDTQLAERTIIFVDGWFGIWNENPCEINNVEGALHTLRKSIDNVQLWKVILGIREDIYEKYQKIFKSNLPSNTRHLYLDGIRSSQNEELEQQLKRTLIKVNCKKRKCSCAALDIQRIKDKYHDLGNHLKVEILARHHCLITKFMECGDLCETLVCHFMELQKKKRRLYECLMYIVIKGKYKIGDDVDGDVIKEFHFGITSESFKDCKSLHKYTKIMPGKDLVNIQKEATPPNQEYIVFEYVFLYLCAFHSLFKLQPKMLMKHCNMDAVLQIVRPDGASQDGDEIKFFAKAENEYVTYFYKEVVKRTPGLEETIRSHPLVRDAIGTEV